MYSAKENLPIKLELPGVTIRSTPWNGMAALYVQLEGIRLYPRPERLAR